MVACSGRVRSSPTAAWHACDGDASHDASKTELKHAIRFSMTDKGLEEHSFVESGSGKYTLCGDCAVVVLRAMLSKSPLKCEKTGKKGTIANQTFISDVLKMTSMKDKTQSPWPTGAARTADALFAECERDIVLQHARQGRRLAHRLRHLTAAAAGPPELPAPQPATIVGASQF
jgi:hypothetical protein